jgi:hypothetical protein
MKSGKERRPHPSQLPNLTAEQINTLEEELRIQVDSWGWVVSPKEPVLQLHRVQVSPDARKPLSIHTTIKAAAKKIGGSMRRRRKEDSSTPD